MRRLLLTIATALFPAALLASAGVGGASAQEAVVRCFDRQPLPGITLAAFAGGGLDRLERCAAGFGVRVHAVAGGAWLTLDPASDGEANAAFRARYASGAAAGTPFLLERETPFGLVVREPDSFEGYTLFTHGAIYLIDHAGRIAHVWDDNLTAVRLLENGLLTGIDASANLVQALGPDGGVAWEYRYDGDGVLHHDFLHMPNGNLLLLVRRTKGREEAAAAVADPDLLAPQGIGYEAVVEVRLDGDAGRIEGEIVWEWSLWDHLIQDSDPDKANYGVVADHPERVDLNYPLADIAAAVEEGRLARRRVNSWIHANSIDYHPELDQIAISARHFSELWIIDHSTTAEEAAGHAGGNGGRGGDLLYRWGNPRAHGAGTADDQQLFWPHAIHWIAPGLPGAGNILIFNNGAEFPGYVRGWSSVVEIAPPADGYGYRSGEAVTPVWTYAADIPESFFSPRRSNAQRLPNGNTLICHGTEGTIFEVTPDGRTVWKYVNPHVQDGRLYQGDRMPVHAELPGLWSNNLYRAARYAPDYPGLAGLDLTPKGTIELYREP